MSSQITGSLSSLCWSEGTRRAVPSLGCRVLSRTLTTSYILASASSSEYDPLCLRCSRSKRRCHDEHSYDRAGDTGDLLETPVGRPGSAVTWRDRQPDVCSQHVRASLPLIFSASVCGGGRSLFSRGEAQASGLTEQLAHPHTCSSDSQPVFSAPGL